MARLNYDSLSFRLDSSERTETILEITTLSFARGQRALKILGKTEDAYTSSAVQFNPALLMPSIHSDFYMIDNFSSYSAGLGTMAVGGWSISTDSAVSTFEKTFDEPMDFSNYDGLSLWCKSPDMVNMKIAFLDSYGHASAYANFGNMPKRWSRVDCSVNWDACVTPSITKMIFLINGESDAEYYLDEILMFGFGEEFRNKTWVPLLITDLNIDTTGRTSVTQISGAFGDVVHQDGAKSRRGNMTFKTGMREMDNDVRFIDNARKMHTKLYLRVGGEGWPIYLGAHNQKPEESIYGVRNEMNMDFIEAE